MNGRRSLKPKLLPGLEEYINSAKQLPRRKLEFKSPPRHSPVEFDFSSASVTEMSKEADKNNNLLLENEKGKGIDDEGTDSTINLRGSDAERYRAWLASQEISMEAQASGQKNGVAPFMPPVGNGNAVGVNGGQEGYHPNAPNPPYQANTGIPTYGNMQYPPVPPNGQFYQPAPNVQQNYGVGGAPGAGFQNIGGLGPQNYHPGQGNFGPQFNPVYQAHNSLQEI
ncbi:hypothetical protein CASFOL_004797 [Castilleja foliolosa]|uniref:Uncharacterized protein n=1 Tax=Castilleja foliolosa TaxID=1961234 RepID=A0ABD3EBH5_9LAMI